MAYYNLSDYHRSPDNSTGRSVGSGLFFFTLPNIHQPVGLRSATKNEHADRVIGYGAVAARDVAFLVRLGLVDEDDGRLSLTELGRQRYEDMPRSAEPRHKDETDLLASQLRHARDH